jgi:hypothetical protein
MAGIDSYSKIEMIQGQFAATGQGGPNSAIAHSPHPTYFSITPGPGTSAGLTGW